MKELLFEAYGKSSDFVADQILYVDGIDVDPSEEHTKQKTIHALRKLLDCALVEECHKFNQEKYEEEYCYE